MFQAKCLDYILRTDVDAFCLDLTKPQFWRGGIQVDRASDRVPLIALSAETLLMLRTSPRREVSDSAGARILHTATLTLLTQGLPPSRALCYVNSCLLLYTAQELFLVDERQECVIVAAAPAPRICHHAFHALEFRWR